MLTEAKELFKSVFDSTTKLFMGDTGIVIAVEFNESMAPSGSMQSSHTFGSLRSIVGGTYDLKEISDKVLLFLQMNVELLSSSP